MIPIRYFVQGSSFLSPTALSGDKPATAEELCAEINKALDEGERQRAAAPRMFDGKPYDGSCGRPLTQADVTRPVLSGRPKVNVRELVKKL